MTFRVAVSLGLIGLCFVAPASRYDDGVRAQTEERPRLVVKPAADFEVNGTGEHAAWKQSEWTALRRRQADGHPYDSRFKVLYSSTGLYFLMEGTDRKLTATMNEDFMDLWNEDVFEVFLWTDERYPVYFEYRDLAAQPRASDPDSEFRRAVSRLASVALREGSSDAQSHDDDGRTEGVAGRDSRLARGVLHPVHAAAAVTERAAEGRHALARQLLPHGPRRRAEHAVGVGARRQELPRVPEVRRSGVRGALSRSAVRVGPGVIWSIVTSAAMIGCSGPPSGPRSTPSCPHRPEAQDAGLSRR